MTDRDRGYADSRNALSMGLAARAKASTLSKVIGMVLRTDVAVRGRGLR
jgi:hypothetical protein